jgi:hypothetical protein
VQQVKRRFHDDGLLIKSQFQQKHLKVGITGPRAHHPSYLGVLVELERRISGPGAPCLTYSFEAPLHQISSDKPESYLVTLVTPFRIKSNDLTYDASNLY